MQKNETKLYFTCKNQQQCQKKIYIRYHPDSKNNIELFLSKSEHNHLQKTIPWETKEEIIKLFNKNIFPFKEIMEILEQKNLDKILYSQFWNLKARFKAKNSKK